MKTLGLVGGTGWVSTVDYYRLINQGINKILGGYQFARCILYSINFGDIIKYNERNDTEGIYKLIKEATQKVILGGAEGIVLCANTLHKFADRLQKEIQVPIIHIAEATAAMINEKGFSTVGLLGTKYTMEETFYTSILEAASIRILVPEKPDREMINTIIYDELLKEVFKESSKNKLLEIMKNLETNGAEGIVLGCTEIPLIIKENDFDLPLFNTTVIHAQAAVNFAVMKSQ
jgi:aspartate racemase